MQTQNIKLYTYEDAVRLYKQRKRTKIHNTYVVLLNWLTSHITKQKLFGIGSLILMAVLSLFAKDPTGLIFMIPICGGLIISKDKVI